MTEAPDPNRPALYGADDAMLNRLELAFTYHPAKGDQGDRYDSLRALAKSYALFICDLTPPSREQSLALTALEEAVMWANAAIARHE